MEAIAPDRSMRLSRWHLVVWFSFWAIAAAIAGRGCNTYNSLAGTAMTPQHVAAIVVGVVLGPEIGPFASSGTFGAGPSAVTIYSVLVFALFASLSPFIFVKQPVSTLAHFLAWASYLAACVAWFGSAILSLGHFLS